MDALFEFFTKGLGLTREQQGFLMRSAWFAVVSFHIMWVCGWLAVIGLAAPFSHADQMDRAISELRLDRIERLEHEILQLRVEQCQATNSEAKRQYGERLAELISRFQFLAQREARVPRCDEL